MYTRSFENELYHHGVKGMKWGVRHDYIPKGRSKSTSASSTMEAVQKATNNKTSTRSQGESKFQLSSKQKTALKVGAAFAATALAVYGGYKMNHFVRSTNFKYHIKEGEEKLNMWASTAFDPENNHSESVQKKLGQIGLDASRREMEKARTDSFVIATRNTYNYLKKNRQKR